MTMPLFDHVMRRAAMTIGCRDAEAIPKVSNAGRVETVDGEIVQTMHNGLRVRYGGYYGDWMANIIHGLRGHHEPQEEKVFDEILRYCRPRSRIVELGAFWAYYSMWYLRSVPFSTAVCVEPDADHLAIGRSNMALNGLQARATFVQAAVGDRHDTQVDFTTETGAVARIPQHTIDSLMDAQEMDAIELLHVDVQGAELAVLRSCAPLIARSKVRFVVVSTHHASISGSTSTHADCLEVLSSGGANVLCEHGVDESFSGDGLIAAAVRPEDRYLPPIEVSRCRRERSLFATGY